MAAQSAGGTETGWDCIANDMVSEGRGTSGGEGSFSLVRERVRENENEKGRLGYPGRPRATLIGVRGVALGGRALQKEAREGAGAEKTRIHGFDLRAPADSGARALVPLAGRVAGDWAAGSNQRGHDDY